MLPGVRKGTASFVMVLVSLIFVCILPSSTVFSQEGGAVPPADPVKLIFIHHSCGENWLMDDHGNLGMALGESNYFVSDTNYGWGPHGIGDRTDILDWPEWFLGPDSEEIMQAVYNESGQNSSYTRRIPDPGGENAIVIFKSCFPNSALEGSAGDLPSDEDWLTVGSAKRVYNSLLTYFMTMPDKLFVVITAPPLQEATHAANARAFNTWLVEDWLEENQYPYANVAVWDFYNVLTHPDNHHRWVEGSVEYVTTAGGDVLFYPDNGDTHPSPEGNMKAADEFVGMLNYYHNLWLLERAPEAVGDLVEVDQGDSEPLSNSLPAGSNAVIDSFEGSTPAGSYGWEAFYDPASETILDCGAEEGVSYSGSQSLQITMDIGPGSWGTCGLMYQEVQNWSDADGISFAVSGSFQGDINLDIYTGLEENRASYVYSFSTVNEEWAGISVPWEQFNRVEWEEDNMPFDPSQISGIAFGFEGQEDGRIQGELRVDDLNLGTSTSDFTDSQEVPAGPEQAEELGVDTRSLCPLSMGLVILVTAAVWILRR